MTSKLLYIEDNPLNMRLVRKLLKHLDIEVLEAMDGITGLRMAQKEKPDIILVDINLPGISGLEVVMRLRLTSGFSQTPIVAITAYSGLDKLDQCLNAGCNSFLAKPINKLELNSTLMQYLGNEINQDLSAAM